MSPWKPLIVSGLVLFGIIYTVIVFNTGNLLWFMSRAEVSDPIRIVIVDKGERITYQPGDPEFDKLRTAISASASQLDNNNLIGIGLSESTIHDYETQYTVMEVHYAYPIKFNTSFRVGEPTVLLFPITGRHAATGLFFRGSRGEWWYGALRMDNPEPLYNALEELGYKATVYDPSSAGSGSG